MAVAGFDDLVEHVGHRTAVVTYGDAADPANVAVECEDCQTVLLDFDRDEPPAVFVTGPVGSAPDTDGGEPASDAVKDTEVGYSEWKARREGIVR